ncbi:MAG: alpha/beta fold hydrolase [Bryobacterales bacterium]|nr:alpha/beta fold hydrolase [Bryobacterales bacterium]
MKVIYLHGFASGPSSSKARFFYQRFQGLGVEIEIPDLAGGAFEALTLTGQLGVVERLAAGAPCVLIGSSMGGYLAALHAARHPEVRKLVLLAPAFGFARRWLQKLGPDLAGQWRSQGFLEVFHYAEQRPRRVGYRLIEDGKQYEDFPDVRQPVLIIHGRRDATVDAECSVEFARDRPNVRLELVDSDHQLLNVLEPAWQLTRDFLEFR